MLAFIKRKWIILMIIVIVLVSLIIIFNRNNNNVVDENAEIEKINTVSKLTNGNHEGYGNVLNSNQHSFKYNVDLNKFSKVNFEVAVYKDGELYNVDSFTSDFHNPEGLLAVNYVQNGRIEFQVLDLHNKNISSNTVDMLDYFDEDELEAIKNADTHTISTYSGMDNVDIIKSKNIVVFATSYNSDDDGDIKKNVIADENGAVSLNDEMRNEDYYIELSFEFK